jgi:hypothetical protein
MMKKFTNCAMKGAQCSPNLAKGLPPASEARIKIESKFMRKSCSSDGEKRALRGAPSLNR